MAVQDCHRLLLKGMTSLNIDALALFQASKQRIFDDAPDMEQSGVCRAVTRHIHSALKWLHVCVLCVFVASIAASLQGQDHDRERERKGLLGAFLAANARHASAEEAGIEPRARSGLPRPAPGPGPSPAVQVSGGSGSIRGLGFGLGSGLSPPPPPPLQGTTKRERSSHQQGTWQAADFYGSSDMLRAARRPLRWPSRPKI